MWKATNTERVDLPVTFVFDAHMDLQRHVRQESYLHGFAKPVLENGVATGAIMVEGYVQTRAARVCTVLEWCVSRLELRFPTLSRCVIS